MGEVGDTTTTGRADPRVSEMFYRAEAQAVLIFGSETWLLLAAM